MPYITSTGTTIEDSFFDDQVEPVSDDRGFTSSEQEVELPVGDVPADDPIRERLRNNTQNGKVPANVEIRTVVVRKKTYKRPDGAIGPDAIILPNCEVYKFERTHSTETRKYWVFGIGDELLYYIHRDTTVMKAWVLFCSGQDPVLLREMSMDGKFEDAPPPLPSGDGTWYWAPPGLKEITPGFDPQGTHQFPKFDDEWFFHVRMVLKLDKPFRIDNSTCVVIATYSYYWRVTRVSRTDPGTTHANDPTFQPVDGAGGITERIPIPNCPRIPQQSLKLSDPSDYSRLVSGGIAAYALIGREGAVEADDLTAAKVIPETMDGTIRLKTASALGWISQVDTVPAVLRISSEPVSALLEASPEWAEYLEIRKPKWVYMQLWGKVIRDADGYLRFKGHTARLEGVATKCTYTN